MTTALPLDQMTVREKLDLMEAIWTDLAKSPDDIPTPEWHLDVLKERQRRIDEGRETFHAWEDAKASLKEIIKAGQGGASPENQV